MIHRALTDLGITEWVLNGEPTSESEFNSMFRKNTGADSNGIAILSSDKQMTLVLHGHKYKQH